MIKGIGVWSGRGFVRRRPVPAGEGSPELLPWGKGRRESAQKFVLNPDAGATDLQGRLRAAFIDREAAVKEGE